MSLQSFFKDRPTNLVYLLLFTAVTRLPFLFRSFPTLPNHWLEDIYFPFIGSYNWVYVVVSFLLTFLNAFLVVLLMNTFNVGRNKTYLFGVLYILLTSYIGYETIFTSSLISDTAVLILLFELFKAHRNKNQYGNIFNIGFWLAAICILHFSNAIYFVFFLIAILALRKTTVKEFIIYLLGFAIPFYFMWMYLFINDSGHKLWEKVIESATFISSVDFNGLLLMHVIALSVLIVLVFVYWNKFLVKRITQARSFIGVVFGLLVATLLGIFLFDDLSYLSLSKVALPLSILVTFLFMEVKKWWIEALLFIFIIIGSFFFIFNDYLSLSL